jgi:hypothetical protein
MKILATILGGFGLIVLLSFLLSWPIMMLWNGCLVDAVDGVHAVTWLQAWGLTILIHSLFKATVTSK